MEEKLRVRRRQCGGWSELFELKSCGVALPGFFCSGCSYKIQIKMIQPLQSRLLYVGMTHSVRSALQTHGEKDVFTDFFFFVCYPCFPFFKNSNK